MNIMRIKPILKKLIVISVFTSVSVLSFQFSMTQNASAGLFDEAKNDACSGAQLESGSGCSTADATKADGLIKRIVNILTVIVGIIAVIMIIVGGLRFVTSGGDANAVSSARKTIIYVVVGLLVVALAQVVVKFTIHTATGG